MKFIKKFAGCLVGAVINLRVVLDTLRSMNMMTTLAVIIVPPVIAFCWTSVLFAVTTADPELKHIFIKEDEDDEVSSYEEA